MGTMRQRTSGCPAHEWDFMSKTAIMPLNKLAVGWDVAAWEARDPSGEFPQYFVPGSFPVPSRWAPPELNDDWTRTHFYSKIVEVRTWNTGRVQTITTRRYPFYRNAWNLQGVVDGDDSGTPNRTLTTDPDQSEDLRLTGYPSGVPKEGEETIVTTNTYGYPFAEGIDADTPAADGKYYNNHGSGAFSGFQSQGPPNDYIPSSVTERSLAQSYPSVGAGTHDDPVIRSIVSQVITLSNLDDTAPYYTTYADWEASCKTMLDSVSLIPGSGITTRERPPGNTTGAIYFDYFGTSATYSALNIVPPDATYNSSGEYVLHFSPDHTAQIGMLMGITLGANDATVNADVFATGTVIAADIMSGHGGPSWPYRWASGLEGYEVKVPAWEGGSNQIAFTAVGSYPNTFCFASRLSTITLKGGIQNALVTAIVSPTHINRVWIFPVRRDDSSGVRYIVTAKTDAAVPTIPAVSTYVPTVTFTLFSGGGYNLAGYIMAEARIRIPVDPLSATQDVACFQYLYGTWPSTYLIERHFNGSDLSVDTTTHQGDLAPGEAIIGPDAITTQGYIQCGSVGDLFP